MFPLLYDWFCYLWYMLAQVEWSNSGYWELIINRQNSTIQPASICLCDLNLIGFCSKVGGHEGMSLPWSKFLSYHGTAWVLIQFVLFAWWRFRLATLFTLSLLHVYYFISYLCLCSISSRDLIAYLAKCIEISSYFTQWKFHALSAKIATWKIGIPILVAFCFRVRNFVPVTYATCKRFGCCTHNVFYIKWSTPCGSKYMSF